MPFVKGQPKLNSSGRKKGTPNKANIEIAQLALSIGMDPVEILLRVANEDWKGLGYPSRTVIRKNPNGMVTEEYVIPPSVRIDAAKAVMPYIHMKRQTIHHTIAPEQAEALKKVENLSNEELDELYKTIQKE